MKIYKIVRFLLHNNEVPLIQVVKYVYGSECKGNYTHLNEEIKKYSFLKIIDHKTDKRIKLLKLVCNSEFENFYEIIKNQRVYWNEFFEYICLFMEIEEGRKSCVEL